MNPTQTPVHSEPTIADVLRRAADHIDRYGFNQGSYYDNPVSWHPATCAAGAIAITAYGVPVAMPEISYQDGEEDYTTALAWLQDYLNEHTAITYGEPLEIYEWNDSPATTAADVIDALRNAAAAWDAAQHGGDQT